MPSEKYERLTAFDSEQSSSYTGPVAGVDEAGRGPLAGPVVAAAVIFLRRHPLDHLDDSKKVTRLRREELFRQIIRDAVIGLGIVDEREIDRINIYQASRRAMKEAVLSLSQTPALLLIDGNMKLDIPIPQRPIIRGDGKSAVIAAASIVAKVYRDALMNEIHHQYPGYAFDRHKGYATQLHLKKIQEFGPSPVHRATFAPVRKMLQEAFQ